MKYYELHRIEVKGRYSVPENWDNRTLVFSGECETVREFIDWIVWKLSLTYEDISDSQRKRIQKALKTSASHSARFRLKHRGMFEITEREVKP